MIARLLIFPVLLLIISCSGDQQPLSKFRVTPYIQNPTSDEVSIVWFSHKKTVAEMTYWLRPAGARHKIISTPILAKELSYSKLDRLAALGDKREPPYKHHVRLKNLKGYNSNFRYQVVQDGETFTGESSLPWDDMYQVHFVVFADSETEPESVGKPTKWETEKEPKRKYLIDQDRGMRNNLDLILKKRPDFMVIAGDLVQSGGEQRDWDEFWKLFSKVASSIYIFPSLGNHDYYAGPLAGHGKRGRFSKDVTSLAVSKYLTYFELPGNGAMRSCLNKRYYSIKYGMVTLISLDVSSGGSDGSKYDTNLHMLSEKDPGGGCSPVISPGSQQYLWLEKELKLAQKSSKFTFVTFHHAPYTVGPHGRDGDNHPGSPLQFLNNIFMRYGVDAVFSGHDEMYERSLLHGKEIDLAERSVDHSIHYYDLGMAGDGLRAPKKGVENPHQKFLAYKDAPEKWQNGTLIEGGRHYGHLDVKVIKEKKSWKVIMTPTYLLPVKDSSGIYNSYKVMHYDDVQELTFP